MIIDTYELVKFLEERNPYPEDIFISMKGKCCRLGYKACIDYVKKYIQELTEE